MSMILFAPRGSENTINEVVSTAPRVPEKMPTRVPWEEPELFCWFCCGFVVVVVG